MPLAEDNHDNHYHITAYENDSISISHIEYKHSILLTPQNISDWGVTKIDDLTPELIARLSEGQPEVVILGTGEKQLFPSPEIYKHFAQLQIGLEVMANSAACRTFNILVAEDRRVTAGFIL
ncbi:MAG: Mth938-like domain-containing protein [Gammaproteobacteria bacterium]|nr:Mth938-like domain-containing protein [Gammaproteobacteria bacterium]